MLTFNLLLKEAGIDTRDVYLVRHQDSRVSDQSVYGLYRSDRERFETYQKLQGEKCFEKRRILASFVAAPLERTLFIGLYSNGGLDSFPEGLNECPLSGLAVGPSTHFFYKLAPDPRLEDFKERIAIEWGWISLLGPECRFKKLGR